MSGRARELRVLHVIDQLTGGGAEASLRAILAATATQVHHEVALLKPDRHGVEFLDEHGLDSHAPSSTLRRRTQRIRHVRRVIRGVHPDLVHATLFESAFAARVAALGTRTPVLVSLVGTPYDPGAVAASGIPRWKRAVVHATDRLLSRHATAHFHAVTGHVAKAATASLGIDPARITVVPRGRDPQELGKPEVARRLRARRQLGIDEDAFLVLAVGREERAKGHDLLLRAFHRVRTHRPDARLVLAGRSGRASVELDDLVSRLGLGAAVIRLGERRDVPELLCATDVFVAASRHEGAAGAVLEAMALEVPVIATDVEGLRAVLEDGDLGVLVDPADSAALAGAIVDVLERPEAARRRAEKARRRFEETHTLDASAAGMLALWHRVSATAP